MASDPVFRNNPIVAAMQQQRMREQQVRENSSRLASAFTTATSTGQGGFRFTEMFRFGCTFAERPYVTVGHVINSPEPVANQYPVASGGVWKWQQNERGFYIGAWLYLSVYAFGASPNYSMAHDFVFTGIAVKDLPDHLLGL